MVAFLEIFQNYITQYHGETQIPLSYLIQSTVQPLAEDDDPATNYTSIEEEMIARAPHTGPAYIADNRNSGSYFMPISMSPTHITNISNHRPGPGMVEEAHGPL
jgi:hypothetical protein